MVFIGIPIMFEGIPMMFSAEHTLTGFMQAAHNPVRVCLTGIPMIFEGMLILFRDLPMMWRFKGRPCRQR